VGSHDTSTNTKKREEMRKMIFISLSKFRKKLTKEMLAESKRIFEQAAKEGLKILGFYYTLGQYDTVLIGEVPDEKTIMKGSMKWGDILSTETLVAVPAEEARKLIE